ncbi:hypothetical protein [Streptomyces sp. NPDC090445]|uniref:hypothetical protein n=1 Tax=Streptomyces sp. NPDC090445 TaxID=3365963 RepID=UPI0038260CE4
MPRIRQHFFEGGPTDTVPMYACANHTLGPDATAMLHQAACTARENSPTGTCTPDPIGDPMAVQTAKA